MNRIEEIKKSKEDFSLLLNLLTDINNDGILPDMVKACGNDSSLGSAISSLIEKINQARENVLPEIDNLIRVIESNISTDSISTPAEDGIKLKDDIEGNINFE